MGPLEFIAFIVLCGLTHLLNGWTYGPHPFQLMLALTVFKILTAVGLVCNRYYAYYAHSVLLKVKVRELMLKKKAWNLGREVGYNEAEGDRCPRPHAYSRNPPCELTHELKGRDYSNNFTIPISDQDVVRIKGSDGVTFLIPTWLLPLQAMESLGSQDCGCYSDAMLRGVFSIEVDKSLPDLFMVMIGSFSGDTAYGGSLLDDNGEGGTVVLQVFSENGSQERNDQETGCMEEQLFGWRSRFRVQFMGKYNSHRAKERLSFSIAKASAEVARLELMHGNISVVQNPRGSLKHGACYSFQVRPSHHITINESGESSDQPCSNSLFKGLQVLLADADDLNRAVTRKLLEKLGCSVSAVSSGFDCLSSIGPASSPFQSSFLELQMPELDGYEVAMRIRKFRSRNWP
ncbi:Detected protein of unknown function [Hibiscus syriacus]|uniref:Response regulatory domain-containing protein n=1 Tax=Hibiscus syriacus TaxID=106335 RepID=A0A6A2X5S7_HIBSY|nr:Detected protein of unknown function [Hibiscus syriacus]